MIGIRKQWASIRVYNVDSKVTVRWGNDYISKEKNKANITKKANKAEEAKEDNKVRVYSGMEVWSHKVPAVQVQEQGKV